MARMLIALCCGIVLLSGCTTVTDVAYHKLQCPTQGCSEASLRAAVVSKKCFVSEVGRRVACDRQVKTLREHVPRQFEVTFLEYQENGKRFDCQQRAAVLLRLREAKKAGKPVLVVVYIHGWHHNAKPTDGNVQYFDNMLARYADALARGGRGDVNVLGVYVGWRGESKEVPIVDAVTLGDRARAADVIGQKGFFREDLRAIASAMQESSPRSAMIVAGHSLGGRLLSRTLLPDVFENKYQPLGPRTLVATLNAAIGADAFRDLYRAPYAAQADQMPTWLNITSLDDWATGWSYPLAATIGSLWLGPLSSDFPSDSDAIKTIGHFSAYKTHQLGLLSCDPAAKDEDGKYCGTAKDIARLSGAAYWQPASYRFFVLRYAAIGDSSDGLNQCGLLAEYPITDSMVKKMKGEGYCRGLIGGSSPNATRARVIPAGGYMWNIEADSSVIDTDGLQATSTPEHNAITQTSLATMLVALVYGSADAQESVAEANLAVPSN